MRIRPVSQVLRFGWEKYILRGKIFVFTIYINKQFSEHNKIWGEQKIWGHCPRMLPPVTKGLLRIRCFQKKRNAQ